MTPDYELRHRLALENPFRSVDRVFDCDPEALLVGIKNIASIPNTLMHKLEKTGFALHTIDKKSRLAGRAVDLDLINPLTGHYMSGSSSGTALNVFLGINDLGIGNDGGGSVLAPAMCVNIYGFISKMIEADREAKAKVNTDGMLASNSIGFMARSREVLIKAISDSIHLEAAESYGKVLSSRAYPGIDSQIIAMKDPFLPRTELTEVLSGYLKQCDVLIFDEGPVDLEGFGDSLFGHFDERTKEIQNRSGKGYLRVANIVSATTLCIPKKEYGCATLLMCENDPEKIRRLLRAQQLIEAVNDPLIERYFLDLKNYYLEGYEV